MAGRGVPFIDGSPRDQPFFCESAAFFNESIIRDIITGRYLKPAVSQLNGETRTKNGTHTTLPLIVMNEERVMRIIVFRVCRQRLTELEEVGSIPAEKC